MRGNVIIYRKTAHMQPLFFLIFQSSDLYDGFLHLDRGEYPIKLNNTIKSLDEASQIIINLSSQLFVFVYSGP